MCCKFFPIIYCVLDCFCLISLCSPYNVIFICIPLHFNLWSGYIYCLFLCKSKPFVFKTYQVFWVKSCHIGSELLLPFVNWLNMRWSLFLILGFSHIYSTNQNRLIVLKLFLCVCVCLWHYYYSNQTLSWIAMLHLAVHGNVYLRALYCCVVNNTKCIVWL